MKKRTRRIISVFLLLTLLFSSALPALSAAAAGDNAITVVNADPSAVVGYAPYVLPPEAAGAEYVPLTLLQSGSLQASWPVSGGLQTQASGADAFVDALTAFAPGVDLKAYGLTRAQAEKMMNDTINTRPELFYFNGIYFSMDGNTVSYIWFMYTAAISVVKAQAARLAAEVEYILSLVPAGLSQVETVLWVNEYLAMNVYYPVIPANSAEDPYWFNVYGILANGIGVCQGYALANCLLLDKLGVTCAFVVSDQMNHAWNLVRLDGQWYHVDTTWNDGATEYHLLDVPGYVNHNYFLLSDSVMKDANHSHHDWVAPAAATSNTYRNYFWTKTTSALAPLDGKWYYVADSNTWVSLGGNYNNSYALHSYDFADASDATVGSIAVSVRPVPTNTTTFKAYRRTPSLASFGGKLYSNDGKTIFSMDTAGGNRVTLNSENLNEANYQSIAGFAVQHGQIRYGVFDMSSSTGGTLYFNYPGAILAAAPTMPPVPYFTVNVQDNIDLCYHEPFKLISTPQATRIEAEDPSLVKVDADGTLHNVAFGKDELTGVWVYGPDGQYTYVIVAVYTDWWQWIIWILLFGWVWY
ncbi:MAG: hypothetical protein LBS96_04560 [Oscillospiraceae bacterium]|jgi:hypothetical protein|nr:hypothetical protein [Oscillospiraceae bacterium]